MAAEAVSFDVFVEKACGVVKGKKLRNIFKMAEAEENRDLMLAEELSEPFVRDAEQMLMPVHFEDDFGGTGLVGISGIFNLVKRGCGEEVVFEKFR